MMRRSFTGQRSRSMCFGPKEDGQRRQWPERRSKMVVVWLIIGGFIGSIGTAFIMSLFLVNGRHRQPQRREQ